MFGRSVFLVGLLTLVFLDVSTPIGAQAPQKGKGKKSEVEMVERLLALREEYQQVLMELRAYYMTLNEVERARWAEQELLAFHRIPKPSFRNELEVPPRNLEGKRNVPKANELFRQAMQFKDRGWGDDYVYNQRRAELLFRQLLRYYPDSDKISDTAYHLGDVYESKGYRQYSLAAAFFERCYQWNPRTNLDARLRAARLYHRTLNERQRATQIYREITTHETDERRIDEAKRALGELTSNRR